MGLSIHGAREIGYSSRKKDKVDPYVKTHSDTYLRWVLDQWKVQ